MTDATDPVFATRTGTWIAPTNFGRYLREAFEPYESLHGVTPGTLRKTLATRVKDAAGIEAARRTLGHRSATTTAAHYAAEAADAPDTTATLEGIGSLSSYISEPEQSSSETP